MSTRLPIAIILAALAFAGFAVWQSLGWVRAAQLFPYYLGLATIILAVLALVEHVAFGRLAPDAAPAGNAADLADGEEEHTPEFRRTGLVLFGWLAGLCGLAAVIGLLAAVPVWVLLLLRLRHGAPWALALGIGAGLVVVLLLLERVLMMRLPGGVLLG